MADAQRQFYEEQLIVHQRLLTEAKKKHRLFTLARLFSFLLIVLSFYFVGWKTILWLVVVPQIILFVYLVNRWLDAKLDKEKEELFIQWNQAEIDVLNGDWSYFDDGTQFKESNHPYAHDMDLFGPKSVYQYVNRTVLPLGAKRLAQTLAYGAKEKRLNQIMIDELSHQIEWTQNFIVESKVHLNDEQRQQSLEGLQEVSLEYKALSILRWILPAVSWSSIIAYNMGLITGNILILIGLLVMVVIGSKLKHTNLWMSALSSRAEKIEVLYKQVHHLQKLQFQTQEGKEFYNYLFNDLKIENGLKDLLAIRKRAEYRMNVVVGVLLNYLFAWDFQVIDRSKKWFASYGDKMLQWETLLAEVEVWISGAVYKFNRGNTCFAIESQDKQFEIIALVHPFVAAEKQVTNDFKLFQQESFLIITGPNMAGKSTYLRSVGWAIISANAGFPILAKSCKMPTVKLYSSMRTADDLTKESSYFHAELSRLRFIMDAIERGEQVFVILDEILKGTNSKDKEQGSAGFLIKLNNLKVKGIIATHDLSLTELSVTTTSFKNVYFDSIIENDELYFDYLVRDGVCKNMNASFLLKKMKLVD
jgi:hypothetical protein